jgi:uncharacterized protein YkwD
MKFARFALGLLALLPAGPQPLARAAEAPEVAALDRVVDADNFDHELLAREIFRVTNDVRHAEGLVAFKPEARLTQAADGQAALLSIRVHSGHDSPLAHEGDPSARVEQAGLAEGTVAENAATLGLRNKEVGRNYTYRELAKVIVQAWMDSPGHRANLLNPALYFLGCGTRVARMLQNQQQVYAIQDFYTPAPRPEPTPPAIRPGATSITR